MRGHLDSYLLIVSVSDYHLLCTVALGVPFKSNPQEKYAVAVAVAK